MSRFKPKDLRERIAQELAAAAGFETAAMIRKRLPRADIVIGLVRERIQEEARAMGYALRTEEGWDDAISELLDRAGL